VVGGCCPPSLRAFDHLSLYNFKAIDSTFSLGLWDWSAKYPRRYKKGSNFGTSSQLLGYKFKCKSADGI